MSRTSLVDKQASNILYTGAWTGLAGGTKIQLEDAKNVGYATATFGDVIGNGKSLANGSGAGKTNLQNGVDFNYDYKLNFASGSNVNIYDNNASGAFTGGRYMRIVHKTKNINDVTGLNIQNIYAKQLTGISSSWLSPPGTNAYIDPQLGRFVLPRPLYWSKLESIANITSAEIYHVTYVPTTSTSGTANADGATAVKFNNGIYRENYAYSQDWGGDVIQTGQRNIYPLGSNNFDWSKGTCSVWAKNLISASNIGSAALAASNGTITIHIGTGITIRLYGYILWNAGVLTSDSHYIGLSINGGAETTWASVNNTLYNLYVVWDKDAGLTGAKTVRVFVNGTEQLSSTTAPTGMTNCIFDVILYGYAEANAWFLGSSGTSQCDEYIDNIKLFSHVVSEDPSWEYNAGTGRESALHDCYGLASNYVPVITGTNNGVGYFYISSSATPVTSSGSGGDETETLKSTTTTYGFGEFGSGGVLCDNSFNALNTTTHYNYEKRIDASTVEDPTDGFGAVAGGIVDTSPSGALAGSTYIRLVDNALNIKNANYPTAGYGGLKMYAHQLLYAGNALVAPFKDRMYVDPTNGRFLLPRPIYWSKLETTTNITTTEIYDFAHAPTWSGTFNYTGVGKFGNCIGQQSLSTAQTADINPFGTLSNFSGDSYTLDAWILLANTFYGSAGVNVNINNSVQVRYTDPGSGGAFTITLNINGVDVSSGTIPYDTSFHDLYIVVDRNKNLSGGKSARVFVDSVEKASSTNSINAFANPMIITCYTNAASLFVDAYMYIDNLKIWKDYIDDGSWTYNGGAGYETAMHQIYGAANSYTPNLAAASSGVGYYRGGTSTRQCVISI